MVVAKINKTGFFAVGTYPLLLACFALLLASCNEQSSKIDPLLLNYENPLGYSWQVDEGLQSKVRVAQEEYCEPNPEFSKDVPAVIQYLNKQYCVSTAVQAPYSQPVSLFGTEEEGEISIVTKDHSKAVLIEYNYLHHFLSQGEPERQVKRDVLAKRLKKGLTKIYGSPIASRYYSQRSDIGFLADDQNLPVCFHWKKKNIGIMLCPLRYVGVDGQEMSLSFIDLDQAPISRELSAMATVSGYASIDKNRALPHEYARKYITSDSILSSIEDWLNSNAFKDCRKNTAPLSDVLNIPKKLIELVQSDIETLSGDALANYAIEIINEDKFDLSDSERDRLAVYLLDQASEQGSAVGKNEIGNLLLYCRFGVEQDIRKSLKIFQDAAELNDVNAKVNLAKLYLAGQTNAIDPLASATKLIKECANSGNEDCIEWVTDLNFYINSNYPKPQFENSKVFD